MKAPQEQFLVFTGLDGAMIDSSPNGIQEILPALELLRARDIPLIATTVKTAEEVMPLLNLLDHHDPFIVENGGAIYIPEDSIKVSFNYQRTIQGYKVIEIGTDHQILLRKLAGLRQSSGFNVVGYSELAFQPATQSNKVSQNEIHAARSRVFSEPVVFQGDGEELQRLHQEAEKQNLRLAQANGYLLLTGDHDEGSAVRLLIQLYREEYAGKPIISIGLGDHHLNAPMLYAVDTPVLVRRADGRFDDQVGCHGLKFTRDPGPLGWNQAVIALVTQDPEA